MVRGAAAAATRAASQRRARSAMIASRSMTLRGAMSARSSVRVAVRSITVTPMMTDSRAARESAGRRLSVVQ
jgi:hypothetical protein